MAKKAQLTCFVPSHTLHFRVCFWGTPPKTGTFLCPYPQDPIRLGGLGLRGTGSLNILPPLLGTGSILHPPTAPLPFHSPWNLTCSRQRCKNTRTTCLPNARNCIYKQGNRNMSFRFIPKGHTPHLLKATTITNLTCSSSPHFVFYRIYTHERYVALL